MKKHKPYRFIGPDESVAHHPCVWLNGDIIPTQRCGLSPWAHIIHYATGVISGIGAWKMNGAPGRLVGFRWPDHAERFGNNCIAKGLEQKPSFKQILYALVEMTMNNRKALTQAQDLYLRLFAFNGSEELGVGSPGKTNVCIITRDLTDYLGLGSRPGVTVLYPGHLFRRLHPSQAFPYAKSVTNYAKGAFFKRAVPGLTGQKFDEVLAEAWNGKELAETTGSCLVIVLNGVIYTPRPEAWPLPSITLDTFIRIARALGRKVVTDKPVTRKMLFRAHEVGLTGTWSGVVPVTKILFDPDCPLPPTKVFAKNGGADFPRWLSDNFHPKPVDAPFAEKPGDTINEIKKIYWEVVRGNGEKIADCPKLRIPREWHIVI